MASVVHDVGNRSHCITLKKMSTNTVIKETAAKYQGYTKIKPSLTIWPNSLTAGYVFKGHKIIMTKVWTPMYIGKPCAVDSQSTGAK